MIRPQPIGIFDGPALGLLLPGSASIGEMQLKQMLRGSFPENISAEWEFYRLAYHRDLDGCKLALAHLLEQLQEGSIDEWVCQYNCFVVEPTESRFEELRSSPVAEIRELTEVAAYSVGMVDSLPDEFRVDGELLAWAMAAKAAEEVEKENFVAARQMLGDGIDAANTTSPIFAAVLLAQSANIAQNNLNLPPGLIQQDLKRAIDIATEYSLRPFEGELWLQLGMLMQQAAGESRGALLEAINAYQEALRTGIDADTNPVLFAEVQNNLGLAYLAMPQTESSSQLRSGIAIQSFRKALESINVERHTDLWARIQMNLANALQYAPSSHPIENLVQAVESYEEVLQVRTKAKDPVSFALVALNQSNALAHLGMFKPALEKASEAYKLFQWYDQAEQAASANWSNASIDESLDKTKMIPAVPNTHQWLWKMDLFERQQFEFFLQIAVERFVERLEQRFRGPEQAAVELRDNPDSDQVWLSGFVDAVFEDFLLGNIDGACFVLRALAKRRLEHVNIDGDIESTMIGVAKTSLNSCCCKSRKKHWSNIPAINPFNLELTNVCEIWCDK
ncbi:MAG: hypothetical protein R3C03_21845 [Pirellulaceae bacterium]